MKTRALASVFAWVVLGFSPGASAQSQPPPPGPEVVAKQFVDAWNAHDLAAFGDLFATDADWVTASGSRLNGREKIRAYLAEEHKTWAKTTRMESANVHVRYLNRSTAVVFFDWTLTSTKDAKDAKGSKTRHGNNVLVATKFGPGWIVAAGQVARKPE
jgi:uncharacterized protein (TIGR02246 family)